MYESHGIRVLSVLVASGNLVAWHSSPGFFALLLLQGVPVAPQRKDRGLLEPLSPPRTELRVLGNGPLPGQSQQTTDWCREQDSP